MNVAAFLSHSLVRTLAIVAVSVVAVSPALADPPVEATESPSQPEVSQAGDIDESTDTVETEAAADETEVALTEEEEEESSSLIAPFSASFSISDTFGLGVLARDEFTVTNANLLSFGWSFGYATPIENLSVSLGFGLSKFTTEAGGSNQQFEARFSDISLGVSHSSIFRDEEYTGINISASTSFKIPTSEASRFQNLITRWDTGIGLSRSFGGLSLSYGFTFRKYFHTDTSVVADLQDFPIDVLARDGGVENIGEALVALDTGVLASYGFSNNLSLSYAWFEGFSTSIGFGFNDTFTYDNGTITQSDEFTNPNAVPGRGHSQVMSGWFDVSYAFLNYFSASVTMSTDQLPRTADNRRVRFPFFDLETGNLENTSLTLSLAASY